jgi:hypothetical protein
MTTDLDLDAALLAHDGRTETLRANRNEKTLERTSATSELENIINDNEQTVLEEFGLSPYRAKIALDGPLQALRNPAAVEAARSHRKMHTAGERFQPLRKATPSTRSGAEWRTLAKRVHSLPIGVRLPIGRYGPRDCSDYLEIERHADFFELILRTDSGEWFRCRFDSEAEVIAAGIHERTLLKRAA